MELSHQAVQQQTAEPACRTLYRAVLAVCMLLAGLSPEQVRST